MRAYASVMPGSEVARPAAARASRVRPRPAPAAARPAPAAAARPLPQQLPGAPAAAAAAALLWSANLAGAAHAAEAGGLPDLTALLADNALILAGGAVLLLIPAGINWIMGLGGQESKIRVITAARALEALGENPQVILLDIRSKAEVKKQGTPDLRGVKRKAVQLPFTKVVKGDVVVNEGFAAKFYQLGGLDAETRVLLLDAAGTLSASAAKQILAAGGEVQKIYVIEGGAEGAGGWKESGLPWKRPGPGWELPSFDLSRLGSLIDTLAEDFTIPNTVKAGLAAGALAGAAFLLVNEFGIALEVLGLVAAAQYAYRLFFGTESREQTLTEIRQLVNSKVLGVAAEGAGQELERLGAVLVEEADSPTLKKLGTALLETTAGSAGRSGSGSEGGRRSAAAAAAARPAPRKVVVAARSEEAVDRQRAAAAPAKPVAAAAKAEPQTEPVVAAVALAEAAAEATAAAEAEAVEEREEGVAAAAEAKADEAAAAVTVGAGQASSSKAAKPAAAAAAGEGSAAAAAKREPVSASTRKQ